MSSDNSKVLLTPRLARRLAAVTSSASSPAESRSPSESPSKEPLSGESPREEKEVEREGLQAAPEQSLQPCTPPTRSPSISASSSSSSSSSPALEPPGDLRREPMNIYNLNAIVRDQVGSAVLHSGRLLSFMILSNHRSWTSDVPSCCSSCVLVFLSIVSFTDRDSRFQMFPDVMT